jgi:hypothetical protein
VLAAQVLAGKSMLGIIPKKINWIYIDRITFAMHPDFSE